MTSEINSAQINNVNANKALSESSLGESLKNTLIFQGGLTGIGAINALRSNHFNLKETTGNLKLDEFKKLKISLKEQGLDTFTTSMRTASNYEEYSRLLTVFKKAEKELAKAQKALGKGKITQEAFNDYTKARNTADGLLSAAVKKLENGEELELEVAKKSNLFKRISNKLSKKAVEETSEATVKKTMAEVVGTNATSTLGKTFKTELTNPFVIFFTAATAVGKIKDEVVPTFKEKGIWAGIKATAKTIARCGAELVSNAGFSAIGAAIGSAIGGIILPGVGNRIGSQVGNIVGSVISSTLLGKIDKKLDKNSDEATIADASQQQEEVAPQVTQVDTNATNATASTNPIVVNSNELPEQAKSIRERKTAKTTRTTKTATRGYAKPQGSLNFYNPQSLSFINSNNSNRLKTNYLA